MDNYFLCIFTGVMLTVVLVVSIASIGNTKLSMYDTAIENCMYLYEYKNKGSCKIIAIPKEVE